MKEEKTKSLSVIIPIEFYDWIEKRAKEELITKVAFIRRIILKEKKGEEK